jgi:ABC-type sugar transport system substrate-binding protein
MTARDVAAAYEVEIPVILMNRGTMSIGSAAGQLVTDRFSCMGKLIEVFAKREEGFSRYALLCDRSNMEDSDSADSFRDMMFTYPDMVCQVEEDVSGQDEEQLKETVRQILAANPYIHAFVCANADEAQAVCDVLAEENISRTVICLDGNEDRVYELCRSGDVYATIVKPAEAIAEKACDEVLHFFEHGSTGENEFRYFAGVIITVDDIAAADQGETEEPETPEEPQPESQESTETLPETESTESDGTESRPGDIPGESKGEMADSVISPETAASPVTEAAAVSAESH